jgi:hypothetical protein
VDSEQRTELWQPTSDAQALAQLRSLIRSYIRGELSHRAFVMQFGVQCLTHDVATPRDPATLPQYSYCQDPDCDGHPIGDITVAAARVAPDVPVVDLEDACMQPAAHDGTGDCGCPGIAED